MKKHILSITLLVLFILCAGYRASAQTLTVTGAYNAQCCVPGSFLWIKGRTFITDGDFITGYQSHATAVGPNGEDTFPGGTARANMYIWLNKDVIWAYYPAGLGYPLASIRLVTPILDEQGQPTGNFRTENISVLPVTPSVPLLRNEGWITVDYGPNQTTTRYNGTLVIPPGALIVDLTIFASGTGPESNAPWTAQIAGPVNGVAPAKSFPTSSLYGTDFYRVLLPGIFPSGTYTLRMVKGDVVSTPITFIIP